MTFPQSVFIARLGDRVLETLPRGEGARSWFSQPNPYLDGAAPSDLLVEAWDPHGTDARAVMQAADMLGADNG